MKKDTKVSWWIVSDLIEQTWVASNKEKHLAIEAAEAYVRSLGFKTTCPMADEEEYIWNLKSGHSIHIAKRTEAHAWISLHRPPSQPMSECEKQSEEEDTEDKLECEAGKEYRFPQYPIGFRKEQINEETKVTVPHERIFYGVDFANTDKTSIIIVKLDNNGKIRIIECKEVTKEVKT